MMYSKEELREVNNTSIYQAAKKLGLEVIKTQEGVYKVKGHGGLFLYENRNRFFSFTTQESGGVIDFVMRATGKGMIEAVQFLIDDRSDVPVIQEFNNLSFKEDKKSSFKLPERDSNDKRLIWYLINERGIDKEVVFKALRKGLIYQDKRKNCVFLGKDKEGTIKYAALRGTGKDNHFKGEAAGSDKHYGFEWEGKEKRVLYVVESPIDALSLVTIWKLKGLEEATKYSVISLGSICSNHLHRYLRENSNVESIVIALDNDKDEEKNWGVLGAHKIIEELRDNYGDRYILDVFTPNEKDWNEELIELKKTVEADRTKTFESAFYNQPDLQRS